MSHSFELNLSGDRLRATYRLIGDRDQARARAEDICVEQTVEFPLDLIESPAIKKEILGAVQSLDEIGPGAHRAVIGFPVEVAGSELTQLMNVVFGNISLKPGIKLVSLSMPKRLLESYRGPRFGIKGLRDKLGVHGRPLLATAIKPMGLPAKLLARTAYEFALGGVDIIKDDHGLADQVFGRYEARVALVSAAVQKASRETGRPCLYMPNVTAPADQLIHRAQLAVEQGAGGLLIAPGLVGLDTMRCLADNDDIALPLMSHASMLGAYTVNEDTGIAPGTLLGTINRLAGADAAIFPHTGGRFAFTDEICKDLMERAAEPMGHIEPLFPVPAGGMSLSRIEEMKQFYGSDFILLIGGDLHRHGATRTESASRFAEALAGQGGALEEDSSAVSD